MISIKLWNDNKECKNALINATKVYGSSIEVNDDYLSFDHWLLIELLSLERFLIECEK